MAVSVREKVKGSGEYWIFIAHKGRRRSKKVGKDKRAAQQIARRIEARLAMGYFSLDDAQEAQEDTGPKFEDYAGTWMDVTVPATCKPSTAMDYRSIMDIHVIPHFGRMQVDGINRMMVKSFLMGKIKDGFAQSTVSHMKSCLAGVLGLAVDDEVIANNPAHGLGKIFRNKPMSEDVNPLSIEELRHLLNIFENDFPEHYPMALTLARTGMRFGEVLGLKRGDINFENRSIKVQRTYSRGKIGLPKNGRSRIVDMSRQLTAVLREHLLQQKHDALKYGWGFVPEWVFGNKKGKPLDINNWRKRVFYAALEKAGMPKMNVHDLRHTYASLLIQGGESLAYVRDQLGHHSIKVTVDIYGHLVPGVNKAAVDRFDDPDGVAPICTLSAPNEKRGYDLMS